MLTDEMPPSDCPAGKSVGVFLINDLNGATPDLVVLESFRNQATKAMESKPISSISPRPLLQILALTSIYDGL